MEFKDVFARSEGIFQSYNEKKRIRFNPRGTGGKVVGKAAMVKPVNEVSIGGETLKFTDFLETLFKLFSAQKEMAPSFETSEMVAFKDGPIARFLSSSMFLESLAIVNNSAAISDACSKAFQSIDFSRKPQVQKVDQSTKANIEAFFAALDDARRVTEEETKKVVTIIRQELGDYARTLNSWYKKERKKDLWQEEAHGWVENAARFPAFLTWAQTKLPLLNTKKPIAPIYKAALEKLRDVLSTNGKALRINRTVGEEAKNKVNEIVEKFIVSSNALPVWFRIRVLAVLLQELESPTYSVRQSPDKRQAKSTSQYVRRVDAAGAADYPKDLDKDVSQYNDETLGSLVQDFRAIHQQPLQEGVKPDLSNIAISEWLKTSSPVNLYHGLTRRVLNNSFIGGAAATQINGSILRDYDDEKKTEFALYFSQKFYNNFVDYCELVGFGGNVVKAFKLINAFMFSGKDESKEGSGRYALNVLFPVQAENAIVFVVNRSIELKEAAERKQETGFVATLRASILNLGGTANVIIVDQQGNSQIVYNVPMDMVRTTGKNPDGSGGIEGVRDKAHADVMIEGVDKNGRPANFSVSLKKSTTNYWGGMSYERSTTNQSREARAKGYSGQSMTSDVDGFALGVRQAYALATKGEEAVSKVIEGVKGELENLVMRPLANDEVAEHITAGFELMAGEIRKGRAYDAKLGGPLMSLYRAMADSQGFAARQIKLEYRTVGFKQFKYPDGETKAADSFWSFIYDREGLYRRALFGDRADNAKVASMEESASHVIVGNPKFRLEQSGGAVVITPKGADDAVILSNPTFKLHNPVTPDMEKVTGLSQNAEFFASALPVLFASQSSGQSMVGIQDLYPRLVPIRRILDKSIEAQVESRLKRVLRSGQNADDEMSMNQLKEELRGLSDEMAPILAMSLKYRIEKTSISADTKRFVSDYLKKMEHDVELTVEVFLALGETPSSDVAKIAEVSVILQRHPELLREEISAVVSGVLSEVFATMPKPPAQKFDANKLAAALKKQIAADVNKIAAMVQERIKKAIPSLDSAELRAIIRPFEVAL